MTFCVTTTVCDENLPCCRTVLQCHLLLLHLPIFSLGTDANEYKSELALIKVRNVFAQSITFFEVFFLLLLSLLLLGRF